MVCVVEKKSLEWTTAESSNMAALTDDAFNFVTGANAEKERNTVTGSPALMDFDEDVGNVVCRTELPEVYDPFSEGDLDPSDYEDQDYYDYVYRIMDKVK